MARRAYRIAGDGRDFDTWRHAQVLEACGKAGLRLAGNSDYNAIAARFESLAGEDGRALNRLMAAETEHRRQLETVLVRTLAAGGFGNTYAETIARSRFGRSVMDLDDGQLRQLVMTVKARVRSKKMDSSGR